MWRHTLLHRDPEKQQAGAAAAATAADGGSSMAAALAWSGPRPAKRGRGVRSSGPRAKTGRRSTGSSRSRCNRQSHHRMCSSSSAMRGLYVKSPTLVFFWIFSARELQSAFNSPSKTKTETKTETETETERE